MSNPWAEAAVARIAKMTPAERVEHDRIQSRPATKVFRLAGEPAGVVARFLSLYWEPLAYRDFEGIPLPKGLEISPDRVKVTGRQAVDEAIRHLDAARRGEARCSGAVCGHTGADVLYVRRTVVAHRGDGRSENDCWACADCRRHNAMGMPIGVAITDEIHDPQP